MNLLAIQYWFFLTLAVLLGVAAIIFVSAISLSPLAFLGVTITAVGFAVPVLIRVVCDARRQGANPLRAATIADDRAGLKGRLATILATAKTSAAESPLWPYLIEDTYGMREAFEPARIESRWISRAILAPLAVGLAIAAIPLVHRYHPQLRLGAGNAPPAEITADIGNLEIHPADPGLTANARVYADPGTLKQLEAKLAQAERSEQNRGNLNRWMNKARRLAGNLQDQVTGRKPLAQPPVNLKLRGENPASPTGNRAPS